MAQKNPVLDFSEVMGGLNTRDQDHIGENEVQGGTYNVRLLKRGVNLHPGARGLSNSVKISGITRMMETFKKTDGSESLLLCSAGKLYEVAPDDETLIQRYNFTALPLGKNVEAWGRAAHNKFWVASGEVAKFEGGANCFPVGISISDLTAWTYATVGTTAGGTLADGVYGVQVGYARKVNGIISLFSRAKDLGNVTLGGGQNTISISNFYDNGDTQANTKIVWLTDANGSTYFFYHEADGSVNASSVTVTSAAERNDVLVYSVVASDNYTPHDISLTDGPIEFLEFHADRLWFSIGNTIYYSRQAGESFDLERFEADAWEDIPFHVKGMFSCGLHMVINTENGLYKIPYGDPTQTTEKINEPFYFIAPRTVDLYKSGLMGLTNGGVRYFDGTTWSENLSAQISNEISRINTDNPDHMPCGKVYRQEEQIEYHLCFCHPWDYQNLGTFYPDDLGYGYPFIPGGLINNVRLILNLDSLFNSQYPIKHWEVAEPAAEYMAIDSRNNFYHVQSYSGGSKIYKFDTGITYDVNVYKPGSYTDGAYTLAFTGDYRWVKYWKVNYKRVTVSDTFRTWFYQIRGFIKTIAPITITVYIDDNVKNGAIINSQYTLDPSIPAGGGWNESHTEFDSSAIFGGDDGLGSTIDTTAVFQVVTDKRFRIPLKMTMKGHLFHMVINNYGYSVVNNPDFSIHQIHVLAISQKGNLQ